MMEENEFLQIEEEIVKALKTVYDPEIPVNIYDLGLIYKVDIDDGKNVVIEMTFTSPSCPAADFIIEDVQQKVECIPGIKNTQVNMVFEPEWNKDMMTDEAKLELGLL
jgi:FeS assembly SUF system protein